MALMSLQPQGLRLGVGRGLSNTLTVILAISQPSIGLHLVGPVLVGLLNTS
jgi:hypothetical protein